MDAQTIETLLTDEVLTDVYDAGEVPNADGSISLIPNTQRMRLRLLAALSGGVERAGTCETCSHWSENRNSYNIGLKEGRCHQGVRHVGIYTRSTFGCNKHALPPPPDAAPARTTP